MGYNLKNISVLVVDDMQPILELMRDVLLSLGFKNIYLASSGKHGYEALCKHDPDLVITDWIMGESNSNDIDGTEFAKMIRRNARSPNPYVPIIMMTGFSSRLRVEAARDAGVTEFMTKPFKARDLYSRICQIIEKPRQFVAIDSFVGPDRRRRDSDVYKGADRRKTDAPMIDGDIQKNIWDVEILPDKQQSA